jgi:pyruvate dehydrogenase E2 component (dihydrolipoamide acetyltransferase)
MAHDGAVRHFRLPDVGEGLTEAEITTWRVKPGDAVTVNQPIVEIETAKAVVELPCPYAGTVVAIHVSEGQVVAVGADIISIDTGNGSGALPSVLVGYGPTPHRSGRRARRGVPVEEQVAPVPSGKVLASPPVRLLAKQLRVDLAKVVPTADDGRIRRRDVEAAAQRPAPAAAPQGTGRIIPDGPGVTRIPIRGVRRFMAEAMVRSAYTAPHVTEWVSVDVTDLLALMDRVRHAPQAEGHRLTPLVFVARSLLRAAGLHPEVNATWDGERGDIVQFADVNLGIAVATPRGLLVPNIRAAQHLEFFDLADALSRLVSRARAGEADLQELSNGTITITNIGVFGVDGGTPILNPGEAAILCMGQVREQPWVVDGVIVVRSIMLLTLSFDHRLIDGALGSQFLGAIAYGLEHPELLLPDVR